MIQRFEGFTSTISDIHRDIQKIERTEMEHFGLNGTYPQYLIFIYRWSEEITVAALSRLCGRTKQQCPGSLEKRSRPALFTVVRHPTGYC